MSRRSSLSSVAILLTVPMAACLMADAAVAQSFQVSGNARFEIGPNALPIPIAVNASQTAIPVPPNGMVLALPSATVQQADPGGGLPRNLTIAANQLTAPGFALDLPLFLANPNIFQIRTSISVGFPRSDAVFQVGGRTGSAIQTFQVPGVGFVRYERLRNQFGGPARPIFGGTSMVVFRVGSPAPCSGGPGCAAIIRPRTPASAFGGPLGFTQVVTAPAPSPGAYFVTVTPAGLITAIGTPLGQGSAHTSTAFAGPWTTGRITVSAPFASFPGPVVLSGTDNRTPGGLGSISLVSGGLVTRSGVLGSQVALGWLNLTVVPEPSLGAQLAAGLGMLAVMYGWRRSH